MTHKKILSIILFGSLVIGTIGVITEPGSFGLSSNQISSLEGVPFIVGSMVLLAILPFLFFLRKEVFFTWFKFAVYGFPAMLGLLFYFYVVKEETGAWIDGPSSAQVATVILPTLFLLISGGIIITKAIQLHKQKPVRKSKRKKT